MHRRAFVSLCALGFLLVQFTDADGLPRRRRSRNNDYYYNTTNFNHAVPQSAQKDEPLPISDVNFNYDRANGDQNESSDQIRVFFSIRDEKILNAKEPVVAEVKLADLTNSEDIRVGYFPVSIQRDAEAESKPAVLEVTNEVGADLNIQPEKVYRLFVSFHRKSKDYNKKTALGRMHSPYYVATSGESRLAQARCQIAMRTFKEYYYAQRGWARDGNYPMDCYAYYMWATGFCTVGATNDWTNLGNLFNNETPFNYGGDIEELAAKGSIHGDYVRMPGHSFMLLAYDAEKQQVWTMEGNFNYTIAIVTRTVNHGWTVGHLREKHIRPGLFKRRNDNTTLTGLEAEAQD